MNKVAVVILNWNGAEMLRQFLPSVLSGSQGPGVQVLVADNASTDSSLQVLEQEFPQVSVIRLEQNYGFAEGYNKALTQVQAEYVVLLNSDVQVTSGWLEPLVAYMDKHPEVAACQPKLRSYRNPKQFEYAGAAGGFLDSYGYPYCRGRILGTVEEDCGQYDTISPILWASGAALFIRLKDYLSAGGLDADFFAHMEEIDLCWRLRTLGRGVACIPQSVVYHVGAATLKESPRKTFLNFRNNLLMLYKNLPAEELNSVLFVRMLLDYVAAFKFLLSGQLGNAVAVFRARWSYHALKPKYRKKRQWNMEHRKIDHVPERTNRFLILDYYLKGYRTYQQMMTKK